MRVTNSMTSNMLLLNLNKNMAALNVLQYQYETGNKIQYASDNPIVAGRALKFRTNIAETEQYIENVSQGKAWLNASAGGIGNLIEAYSKTADNSIRSIAVRAANAGTNSLEEYRIYTDQIKETLKEMLGEMNGTYTGRYIYSGYKTDQPPVITKADPSMQFDITQNFSLKDIETYKVYEKASGTAMPAEKDVHRIKLPYDKGILPADIKGFKAPVNVVGVNSSSPNAYSPASGTVNYVQDTGELIFHQDEYDDIANDLTLTTATSATALQGAKDALAAAGLNGTAAGAGTAVAALTTLSADYNLFKTAAAGTVALDANAQQKLTNIPPSMPVNSGSSATDKIAAAQTDAAAVVTAHAILAGTPGREATINAATKKANESAAAALKAVEAATKAGTTAEIGYKKTGFEEHDLNPAVYFDCKDLKTGKTYTMDGNELNYEFGVNNKMQVNTLAKDVITPKMLTDLKDIIKLVDNVKYSDRSVLIAHYQSTTGGSLSAADAATAADKQITDETKFYGELIGKKFTELLGNVDKHSAVISKENTSIGARLNRLELINTRLLEDKINYEELKVDNENVDMAETYVKYQSMYSVYMSALKMGAQISQLSLVDFV